MDVVEQVAPLASFEDKWLEASPELRLALGFVAPPRRAAHTAFACLACEIEHAALDTREDEPAAIKLQWWADELVRAGAGTARHPLTLALADELAAAAIPTTLWHALVGAALGLREQVAASDADALLLDLASLQQPLAEVEARLFGPLDVAARTRQRTLDRALRDVAVLADRPDERRLVVPLDLLAQHHLARADLARDTPARRAALADWLTQLVQAQHGLAGRRVRLGVIGAAALRAWHWRARKAARAPEPLAALRLLAPRLPFAATWAAWRAARMA